MFYGSQRVSLPISISLPISVLVWRNTCHHAMIPSKVGSTGAATAAYPELELATMAVLFVSDRASVESTILYS